MSTYDIFDDACSASLSNERASIEKRSTVLLQVALRVGRGNAETLELANNAYLRRLVLDDHVAWTNVLLSSSGTLHNGATFSLSSVWDPSLDDDVT